MRLIDADTLKAEFTGNFQEKWHYTGIRAAIDNAPTVDAVEVIRCKECAYCEKQLNHLYCGTLNAVVTPDWYCSFGKEET